MAALPVALTTHRFVALARCYACVHERTRRMSRLCMCRVQTPERSAAVSKRQWDGIVRAWRRRLHLWDASPASGGRITLRTSRVRTSGSSPSTFPGSGLTRSLSSPADTPGTTATH